MSPEVIQLLLGGDQHVAILNLNSLDRDGRSPLFYSLITENTYLLNELIQAGANINQQDQLGWTTLHHAVQRHNVQATHLLLKSGVDLEIKDKYGNTPLLRAVFESKGKGEIIKLLLEFEANIYNQNDSGTSPIELAESIANYNIIQFFRN